MLTGYICSVSAGVAYRHRLSDSYSYMLCQCGQGVPHLSQFFPYAMHNVPIRQCASKPHELHFLTGGQQLRVGDNSFIPISVLTPPVFPVVLEVRLLGQYVHAFHAAVLPCHPRAEQASSASLHRGTVCSR